MHLHVRWADCTVHLYASKYGLAIEQERLMRKNLDLLYCNSALMRQVLSIINDVDFLISSSCYCTINFHSMIFYLLQLYVFDIFCQLDPFLGSSAPINSRGVASIAIHL